MGEGTIRRRVLKLGPETKLPGTHTQAESLKYGSLGHLLCAGSECRARKPVLWGVCLCQETHQTNST